MWKTENCRFRAFCYNDLMKNKSFTLIELLVVIAVIGLLASIVIVNLIGTRSKANIAKGLQFSQSVHHALGSEAVGVWSFDEGSGTTAYDASGYGNDGTLVNGPVWRCASIDPNYTPSGSGCSLQFDGIDDYVNCGNKTSLQGTAPLSGEAWIKINSILSSRSSIVGKGYLWQFQVALSNAKLTFVRWTPWETVASNTSLSLGKWYHVAFTLSTDASNNLNLYINGVLDKTGTITTPLNSYWNSANLKISGYIQSDINYFDGFIDEVRIYNEALSNAQIQKLYAEGIKRHELVSNEY